MSAQPLVMVPGLNCTARLYAPQVAAFAPRCPVFVPDPSGHDTVAGMAADILARAPNQFALVGLSMGGYVALEILRQAPGRVSRVVLMDTSAKPDAPERSAMRREQVAMARAGGFRTVVERLWPNLVHPARHEDLPLKEVHVQMAETIGVEGYAREIDAIIGRIDSRPFLSAIHVPVQVIVGEQDLITPVADAKELAEGISGAQLHVLPYCGHLSTIERPHTVTELLAAFLFETP